MRKRFNKNIFISTDKGTSKLLRTLNEASRRNKTVKSPHSDYYDKKSKVVLLLVIKCYIRGRGGVMGEGVARTGGCIVIIDSVLEELCKFVTFSPIIAIIHNSRHYIIFIGMRE